MRFRLLRALRTMNSEKCAFLTLIFCVSLLILHVYWNYDDRVNLRHTLRSEEQNKIYPMVNRREILKEVKTPEHQAENFLEKHRKKSEDERPLKNVPREKLVIDDVNLPPVKPKHTQKDFNGVNNDNRKKVIIKPDKLPVKVHDVAASTRTGSDGDQKPDEINTEIVLATQNNPIHKPVGKEEVLTNPPALPIIAEVNVDANAYPTRKRRRRKNGTAILQPETNKLIDPVIDLKAPVTNTPVMAPIVSEENTNVITNDAVKKFSKKANTREERKPMTLKDWHKSVISKIAPPNIRNQTTGRKIVGSSVRDKQINTIPEKASPNVRNQSREGKLPDSSIKDEQTNPEKTTFINGNKREDDKDSTLQHIPVKPAAGSLLSLEVSFPLLDSPYRGYWVAAEGDLLHRTKLYNAAIAKLRAQVLRERGFKSWQEVNRTNLEVLWGSVDDFHEKLSKRREIKTVYLPWREDAAVSSGEKKTQKWNSLTDTSNILVQEYHTWVATGPLCMWIETPGLTRARWDAVYNRTCPMEFHLAKDPRPLEPVYLHGKPININHYWPNDGNFYPDYFYTTPPKFVYYLHVAEDAVITPTGDIITGVFKLVPYTCAHDTGDSAPGGYDNTPIYKEVFALTQFWGNQFFHRMIEMIPRLMPYLDFLREHKEIMIAIPGEDSALREFLAMFGISSERTVVGMVRAKVAYMPRGTPCGFALVQETQLFARYMRGYIAENLSAGKRDKIVMIRRSGLRHFRYNDHIQKSLRELAAEYRLELYVFVDNPTPPLAVTMRVFHEAVLVVGPHGAGLSNLIYSRPGTLVIEGVCNPPHVNMCFQRVAHVLGHRYHGIPSRTGCENDVQIYPEVIDFVARKYLDLLSIGERQST